MSRSFIVRRNSAARPSRRDGLHVFRGALALALIAAAAITFWPATTSARGGARAAQAPQSKTHIETWAFDDGCNGGSGASSSLVRGWVTFAESHCGLSARKARANCHAGGHIYCSVMQYLDAQWYFANDHIRLSHPSSGWWLHTGGAHGGQRILSGGDGGVLLNQGSIAVRAFCSAFVRNHFNADDGLLMDWQSPSLSQLLYYSTCHCASTREIHANSALRGTHTAMSSVLKHRDGTPFLQVDNTLPPNPFLPQGLDMLNSSIGVRAWMIESQPMNNGTFDPFYATLLDQIAYVATRTNSFIIPMSVGSAGAPYQLRSRRVQEGTMLLGYQPQQMVDWANLEEGSRDLPVWPEEGIYPTEPRQSMTAPGGPGCLAGTGHVCSRGGHNSLRVTRGVFRREFSACYRRGALFGGCATIVNTTGHAVRVRPGWLSGHYSHQIAMRGGDVQSHGHLDLVHFRFTAGTTQVGAHDAILLAP